MNRVVTDLFTLEFFNRTLIMDTISVEIDFIIYRIESPNIGSKRILTGKDLNFALYFQREVFRGVFVLFNSGKTFIEGFSGVVFSFGNIPVLFDEEDGDTQPAVRNRDRMIPMVKNFIFLDLLNILLILNN